MIHVQKMLINGMTYIFCITNRFVFAGLERISKLDKFKNSRLLVNNRTNLYQN